MKITHHSQISTPNDKGVIIPLSIFNKEIRDKIKEFGYTDMDLIICSLHLNFIFLYMPGNNRIDIWL